MMSFLKNIAGNSLLLFSSRIISKIATIIVVILIARRLGSELFGVYSGIMALTSIAGLVADFGLVIPTVRTMSCSPGSGSEAVSSALPTRLFWSCVALIIIINVGMILRFSVILTLLFAIGSILEVFMTGLIRTFEARQDMKTITIFSLTERLVYTCFIALGVWLLGSLQAVALCYAASYAVMACIALYVFQSRFSSISFSFSVSELKRYTKIGFPFFLIGIASVLYYKIDTLFLTAYRPSAQVGIYNAAIRVIDSQVFIPYVLIATVFPSLSKLFRSNNPEFFHVLRQSILLFAAIGLAIGGVIFFCSPIIIKILYSTLYSDAIPVLRILSLMIVFYFTYFILGYGLMALHRETIFTTGMIITAGLSILGNYFVIPRYGYIGASWMRVATEGILTLMLAVFLYREVKKAKSDLLRTRDGVPMDGGATQLFEIPSE
jgi:O-antigen/teichoic acid export membrane protein